ncbi:MAG: uroporphyrinogen-III C-methyltransferase [Aliiglaciecola sp.]
MTEKDDRTSHEEEMKALEKENASYIEEKVVEKQKTTVEEKQPAPAFSESAKSNSNESIQPAKTKTGGLWFVSLLNFILLLVAVAAGYWFWQQWQAELQNKDDSVLTQQNALNAQNRLIETLQAESAAQAQNFQRQVELLKGQIDIAAEQAAANSRNLADVSGRRPSDWLLAEADYLVRMAGRKLWLENDVRTAIAMLQSADSRLQDLADPSLLNVRRLIATDIQTLQQINPTSLTSVALALSGMVAQVSNLPLSLPEVEVQGPAVEQLTGLERVLRYITDNFKYQPNSQPMKPLLSAQQQWLAREQLRYALLQAQAAVTKEQETLFRQSIQNAIGMLVQHFDLEDIAVEQFIGSLQNIENTPVDKNYPQTLNAAQPLQDVLENRMRNVFSNGKFEL